MKRTLIFAALVLAAASMSALTDDGNSGNGNNGGRFEFKNGTLVVSRSVYTGTAATVTVGQTLPPGCVARTVSLPLLGGGTASIKVKCAVAVADGTYPTVFANDGPDGSFGVTSPIFLDNIKTNGEQLGTLAIPTNQIVTSFSSKSELALNRSTDGKSITFTAYHGGPGFITAAQPTGRIKRQHTRRGRSNQPCGHLIFPLRG